MTGLFRKKDTTFLAVIPRPSGGGAERVALNLVNSISRRGVKVHLVVFDASGPLRIDISKGLKVHDLGTGSLTRSFFPLIALVWKLRPSVIFSTLGYVNLALLAGKLILPACVRLWVREANLPSLSLASNRYTALMWVGYTLFYRKADLVIATSERMRREFVEQFRVPAHKVCFLPNPVMDRRVRTLAASHYVPATSMIHFIAVGRLTRQKGFDRLLSMLASLDDLSWQLTILGIGQQLPDLIAQAKKLGIYSKITFAAFQSNPWKFMSMADAFLLPSRWEGMPNAALEALACGLPVIATPESGGIAEVAAVAEPGAVQVVEVGRPFIEAMRRVTRRPKDNLSPSLLPKQYRLESVVDTFESWLNQID
jgi:glycosyltransferase involved in cell wall biosynthesis